MSVWVKLLRWILRIIGLACLLASVALFKQQLGTFKSEGQTYASGSMIAGIPVGGLDQGQASQQVQQAYAVPVELSCAGQVFQAAPSDLGFSLDLPAMQAAAARQQDVFSWQAFWAYLNGAASAPVQVPLSAHLDEAKLKQYLATQAAMRCGQPASAARPYPGTLDFIPGHDGSALDIEGSTALVGKSIQSLDQRSITLPVTSTASLPSSSQNLKTFLEQTIHLAGFDGIAGVYFSNLQSGDEFTFVLKQGKEVDKPEAVSFTGASTIKIPIIISVMRRVPESPDAATEERLRLMIGFSNNDASDWLMKNLLDPVRGPLKVTEDMHTLGLQSTFLAGFFALHSPLLERYVTPGNSRTDLNTDPDQYNQANPQEIGRLLLGIYQCANQGQGMLVRAFPGEITQSKCQVIIKYLKMDRMPYMIQYGLPDGTVTAHKHGWVSDAQNIIHDMSDAAIVYTPYGDYVLTIYLYKPDLLVFEDGNKLVGDLSKVVYNYFKVNAGK